jgi:hypothetical protein
MNKFQLHAVQIAAETMDVDIIVYEESGRYEVVVGNFSYTSAKHAISAIAIMSLK